MYKVYVNGLLCVLTNHCYVIQKNLQIRTSTSKNIHKWATNTSPSFADDITLFVLHPSFLKTFMIVCYKYSIKRRYECYHSKSGIVTFVESKPQHFEAMKNHEWLLGDTN